MRSLGLFVLLLAAACAPASSAAGGPPPLGRESRILETGSGADIYLAGEVRVMGSQVAGAPTRVWSELLAVYREMGIELTTVDRNVWRVGNGQFIAFRRLAGRPMTTYVSCGATLSGPVAANNRIQMSVDSELEAVGSDSTRIRSWITATAHSTEGASRNALACSSTGALERDIAARVARRLSEN
jgi:hypothetical protein